MFIGTYRTNVHSDFLVQFVDYLSGKCEVLRIRNENSNLSGDHAKIGTVDINPSFGIIARYFSGLREYREGSGELRVL
jgi:hypothetical protein